MNVQNVNMISVCDLNYVDTTMGMGNRLKAARLDAGIRSVESAAKRLGLAKSTYAAHENGQNNFNAEQAAEYAKAYKVSASWLLFGHGDKNAVDSTESDIENIGSAEDAREKINELVRLLSPQQTNVFLTLLQSFIEALGIPEGASQDVDDGIEDKVFLGDPNEPLDRAWLENASKKVRQQEKALTDQAIFNSEESDRRLKREYNRLYLQRVSEQSSSSK